MFGIMYSPVFCVIVLLMPIVSSAPHSTPVVTATGSIPYSTPVVTATGGIPYSTPVVTATGSIPHSTPVVTATGSIPHGTPVVTATGSIPSLSSTEGIQSYTQASDVEQSSFQNGEIMEMSYFTWSECNQDSNRLIIRNVGLSPDPVLPGQDMSLDFILVAPHTITSGSIDLKIWKKLGTTLLSFYEKKWTLSQKVPLPLAPGDNSILLTREIPEVVPPGPYLAQVTILDQNNNIGCIDFTFHIV